MWNSSFDIPLGGVSLSYFLLILFLTLSASGTLVAVRDSAQQSVSLFLIISFSICKQSQCASFALGDLNGYNLYGRVLPQWQMSKPTV